MILVLTYHKVIRNSESKAEFYSITAEQLERQLELLAQSGLRALAPEELLGFCCSSRGEEAQTQQSDQSLLASAATAPPGSGPEGSYLLTFDDGTVDHYEVVLPLLERYRRRAIFFAPSSKLNRPGYLTSQQAAGIHQAGHTLGLHSHEHRRLDWLGEEDIRVQMELSTQALGELTGRLPVMFAPPGGYIDRRVMGIALEQGVQVIRTMRWGYNRRLNLTALQCVPVNRFFTEEEFGRVLKLRDRSFLYTAKELTKKLVPTRAYERLRGLVFASWRRK